MPYERTQHNASGWDLILGEEQNQDLKSIQEILAQSAVSHKNMGQQLITRSLVRKASIHKLLHNIARTFKTNSNEV